MLPLTFQNIVLVSNKKLALSKDTGSFLTSLKPTLYVYHNHSETFTRSQLRSCYSKGSSEVLSLMPNHLNSYWGLDKQGNLLHDTSDSFPLQCVITHFSPPPLHSDWHWIDGDLIKKLTAGYPPGKIPTNGFITRNLFQSLKGFTPSLENNIMLYGFTMDDEYINSPAAWDGHDNLYERQILSDDVQSGECIKLTP